jgi:hypothetical protein
VCGECSLGTTCWSNWPVTAGGHSDYSGAVFKIALQYSSAPTCRNGSIASVRVCWPYVRSYPDSDRNSDLRARRLSAIRRHRPSDDFDLIPGSVRSLPRAERSDVRPSAGEVCRRVAAWSFRRRAASVLGHEYLTRPLITYRGGRTNERSEPTARHS